MLKLVSSIGGLIMRGLILATAATAALAAAALTGCYAEGDVGASATYPQGGVYASSPDLVTVSPGVQVVADYDEPVFFHDNFYWRFYDGYWYRSNNYYSGWYYYERPPVAVLRIERPYAYAHYRPAGYVARSSTRYQRPAPIVRDHRAPVYTPAARGQVYTAPSQPAPVVRDHRGPVAAPPAATQAPATRAPAQPAQPAPVVRDHRKDAKDTRDHRH
jgi:hypothetical protein